VESTSVIVVWGFWRVIASTIVSSIVIVTGPIASHSKWWRWRTIWLYAIQVSIDVAHELSVVVSILPRHHGTLYTLGSSSLERDRPIHIKSTPTLLANHQFNKLYLTPRGQDEMNFVSCRFSLFMGQFAI
jgi:hypothetical protein